MLSSMKTESHTQEFGWISETFTQNWLSGIKSDFEFFCFILVASSNDQSGLSDVCQQEAGDYDIFQ